MKSINSFAALETLGRVRLSPNFFMRDFLHSEIAAWHQLRNIPDFPERAIESGQHLCVKLLEPLQSAFGRIHVRSGYRSPLVNGFGNEHGLNCASNESNFAGHIWDYPDEHGHYGATACVVIPWLVEHIGNRGSWTDMAWWIHDHLDYNTLCFFPKLSAFNINWHAKPVRRIDSYAEPRGCLTRPGMSNHAGLHADQYIGLPSLPRFANRAVPSVLCVRPQSINGGESHENPGASTTGGAGRGGVINYRAIHTRTSWRKAFNHASIDSAIYGADGAAGLFARRARIRYDTHGDPLYVLVWVDGQESGYVVKPEPQARSGIRVATAPVAQLLAFEARRGASAVELEPYFTAA